MKQNPEEFEVVRSRTPEEWKKHINMILMVEIAKNFRSKM